MPDVVFNAEQIAVLNVLKSQLKFINGQHLNHENDLKKKIIIQGKAGMYTLFSIFDF
jgi:hypothetical protein